VLRDEEAVGSNPATPTSTAQYFWAFLSHVACREIGLSHYPRVFAGRFADRRGRLCVQTMVRSRRYRRPIEARVDRQLNRKVVNDRYQYSVSFRGRADQCVLRNGVQHSGRGWSYELEVVIDARRTVIGRLATAEPEWVGGGRRRPRLSRREQGNRTRDRCCSDGPVAQIKNLRTGVGIHHALPAHRVDPGRIKETDAVAQHRPGEMHMELIDQAALQALSGEVQVEHHPLPDGNTPRARLRLLGRRGRLRGFDELLLDRVVLGENLRRHLRSSLGCRDLATRHVQKRNGDHRAAALRIDARLRLGASGPASSCEP
jgi:hypothetical protein